MVTPSIKTTWCAIAVLAVTFLSAWPQLHFWLERGSGWQGAYIVLQMDELLYSAYAESIIDGRPRRSDPITGRDDHQVSPMHESLFSIQFVPAFILGSITRPLNGTASSAFIALLPIAGFLGSLSVYWLIFTITADPKTAAVGTLLTFALAGLIAGQGIIGLLIDPETRFLGLPFLRRYEPAAPWFMFFLFCGFVWRALNGSRSRIYGMLAGLTFTALVFSYVYLWTAALAWVVEVVCLWAIFKRKDISQRWSAVLLGLIPSVAGLLLFGYLALRVSPTTSDFQVFTYTRRPDLFRPTEVLAFILIVLLAIGIRAGKIQLDKPQTIFALSLLGLPCLLFNQQIVTGRSVQPFHYEVLVANYVVVIGAVLMAHLFQFRRRTTSIIIAIACISWMFLEVEFQYRANAESSTRYDEMVPVMRELKARASRDDTWQALSSEGKTKTNVFSPVYGVSALLPSWAPQSSLLAAGAAAFQTIDANERRSRLYLHLYFCGYSPDSFRSLLNSEVDPFGRFVKSTLFGPERVVMFLGKYERIRPEEIETAIHVYNQFTQLVSTSTVNAFPVSYVIAQRDSNLSNVDRWYTRTALTTGPYILYHVHPR